VMLPVGRMVFYPCCGPCSIAEVSRRGAELFYRLVVRVPPGEVFVPVTRAESLGLRPLASRSEVDEVLRRLRLPAVSVAGWRERTRGNQSLLATGSANDLAEVVTCLTSLRRTHELGFGEARTLERALTLLVDEIAAVTGRTSEATRTIVDRCLEAETSSAAAPAARAR
jgi:RNA polymerase-interacting CarD/CdnL/TRCF family regulator